MSRSSRLTQPVKQSGCPSMAGGPPPSCKVGEWILSSSHHLCPRQQGIPGWSGPLGGSEGLDQHAPWGGQAPGPQPTFEKQVRLQVTQNTSQLCWPQSRPLGSPGPKTQKPVLLNGARAKLTVSPVCLWVPSLGLSCRSGAVCFPLPPDTYHTGGSFHTGASSWGSWEGGKGMP